MLELPTDLPADLVPLSWLLGVWEGTGVIDYESGDGRRLEGEFAHRVSFSHDGGDYLNYSADAWLLGDVRLPLVAETGFWRLGRPASDADAGPGLLPATADPVVRTVDDVEALRTEEGGFAIEVSIVHSDGVSELYLGQVRGPRIDIATDAVMRSASTKPYAAATRMYGLVENHLLWAWDIAALGAPLASHASARLARVQ
ncbi:MULTISPECIES: FABP family protein [unclassified Microbacterium]|uniref:FABP family protein n=1 Tax=unclassified Microbacterium TaxID=2609290 RepID=UPI00214B1FA8|nr:MULTISPECIES: FABP family protein [unclassified Microbacterium]MCR2784046.1 FABP family protein [Microbacterium sp. zg.B96]MDL5351036.1 FABP family protein [Microbacterium sp. zg-YB36]WIM15114.1 FABP family protein [Microbacterium sp. zg-B96]